MACVDGEPNMNYSLCPVIVIESILEILRQRENIKEECTLILFPNQTLSST
jgi:hypothetical protein